MGLALPGGPCLVGCRVCALPGGPCAVSFGGFVLSHVYGADGSWQQTSGRSTSCHTSQGVLPKPGRSG